MAAPTRVQTTPQIRATSTTTVAVTFNSQPIVGNAIIVTLIMYNAAATPVSSVVDNQGNSYSLAVQRGSGSQAIIYYCPKIATTGTPFTITITGGSSSYFEAVAIEVTGVGTTGLIVDKTQFSTPGASTTINTGNTAALTNSDVFAVAVVAIAVNLTSLVVDSVTPTWVQELENLNYSATVAGEANSRSLTGVSGTTQSCGWTLNTAGSCAAVIAIFAPTGVVLTDIRITQDVIETLSLPFPTVRTTQYVVELLSANVSAPPSSTETTQFVIIM